MNSMNKHVLTREHIIFFIRVSCFRNAIPKSWLVHMESKDIEIKIVSPPLLWKERTVHSSSSKHKIHIVCALGSLQILGPP